MLGYSEKFTQVARQMLARRHSQSVEQNNAEDAAQTRVERKRQSRMTDFSTTPVRARMHDALGHGAEISARWPRSTQADAQAARLDALAKVQRGRPLPPMPTFKAPGMTDGFVTEEPNLNLANLERLLPPDYLATRPRVTDGLALDAETIVARNPRLRTTPLPDSLPEPAILDLEVRPAPNFGSGLSFDGVETAIVAALEAREALSMAADPVAGEDDSKMAVAAARADARRRSNALAAVLDM